MILCDALSILEQKEGSRGRTGETQRKPGVGDSVAPRLLPRATRTPGSRSVTGRRRET